MIVNLNKYICFWVSVCVFDIFYRSPPNQKANRIASNWAVFTMIGEMLNSKTRAVEQQATLESYYFRQNFLKFSDGLAAFDGELEDQWT